MTRHRPRLYKEMSLEVAVRNPERYEEILSTLSKYEGRTLDSECILDIYVELYLDGVLTSLKLTEEEQRDPLFMREYIVNNNRHNNEWGFPTGYEAAFTRYLDNIGEEER